jgi:hypothetical protein
MAFEALDDKAPVELMALEFHAVDFVLG